MDLKKIAQEIRETLEKRRQELELTFIEDEHIYYMKDLDGEIKSNFPSVSKVIKKFYIPFDAESKAYDMTDGNESEAQQLLEKWKAAGDYSTNLGSRVHYVLESDLVQQYNNYKDVRQPIFECDNSQIDKSNQMIYGGKQFLDLMHERGAVLLDTEIVLGDPEFGYTGQPDKVWIMFNKNKTGFGFVITDWKTNKEKNMEVNNFTKPMKKPFENLPNNALGHYNTQLPFYGKLLLKMLEGTKYGNIPLLGGVIIHLTENTEFKEYRIPRDVVDTILNMDMSEYLTK